jgi:hypothetical protein
LLFCRGVGLRGLLVAVLLGLNLDVMEVGSLVAVDSLVVGFGSRPCRVWSLLWN